MNFYREFEPMWRKVAVGEAQRGVTIRAGLWQVGQDGLIGQSKKTRCGEIHANALRPAIGIQRATRRLEPEEIVGSEMLARSGCGELNPAADGAAARIGSEE